MKFCHLQQIVAICNNMDGPTGYYVSEISQKEKDKYSMLSLICGI